MVGSQPTLRQRKPHLPVADSALHPRHVVGRLWRGSNSLLRSADGVVRGHSERAKALGAVLTTIPGGHEERLIRWAIYQLRDLGTPAAIQELKRFRAEIDALPRGSEAWKPFGFLEQELTHVLRR